MADEDKYKNVIDVAKEARIYRAKELEFTTKARKMNKPFCTACFKHDYDSSNLKDFSEYIKAEKIIEHEIKHRRTQEIMGKMIDYECPKGHNLSLEMTNRDLEKLRAGNINTSQPEEVEKRTPGRPKGKEK